MKFLIFILIIFLSHLSDAQNSTSSALEAKTSPTLPPFSDPFWPYPLGACLTCNYPLFATFINGELPNGEYQPGYPYEYRKPCECPRGIPKVEIDHACFPNHVLYPYYESCHHKAYCCDFGSCNCTNCPPNKHVVLYNPPNFECQCNNYMLKCANLTEYNKETCVCECPRDAYLKCPANQYFDRKTCSCLCRDPQNLKFAQNLKYGIQKFAIVNALTKVDVVLNFGMKEHVNASANKRKELVVIMKIKSGVRKLATASVSKFMTADVAMFGTTIHADVKGFKESMLRSTS